MWICDAFGHKFRARYDTVPPSLTPVLIRDVCAESIIKCATAKIYKIDFCQRCGATHPQDKEESR